MLRVVQERKNPFLFVRAGGPPASRYLDAATGAHNHARFPVRDTSVRLHVVMSSAPRIRATSSMDSSTSKQTKTGGEKVFGNCLVYKYGKERNRTSGHMFMS